MRLTFAAIFAVLAWAAAIQAYTAAERAASRALDTKLAVEALPINLTVCSQQ